ncbi:ankyrin repeat domain-containing protein 42-like, partial [Diadema antillarum]|uniref:ankyrin repeat domain-containing protein 42-like n=1 Tax=Diadema antillarum TaxID=105358 RepID=UPI003A8B4E79
MPVGQRLLSVHDAVRNGDVLELEAMVKRGASMNEVDSRDKFTPLHWAAHSGALECLHWLLWHGADPTVTTPQGWTPAHVASIRGQDQCIQALATNGVSMTCRDLRGNTPAHLAAAHGNSYTLSSILRAGTDIEGKNLMTWTAAHVAAFHGRLGCLQLLVKWGGRTDEADGNGNIPAHLAAQEGHLPCLKFLVSNGATMTDTLGARNDNGDTPKTLASQYYKQNCVDYINAVEWERDHPEDQENLAFPAHMAAGSGDISHLRMLIEQGVVNINERDDKGSTPAHRAAGNGNLECLQWLVEMGANIHVQNNAGETPMDVASRFAQLACVKLLKGDDSDSDNEVMADYADPEARQDRILQRSVDHGVEGESIPLSSRQKEEARGSVGWGIAWYIDGNLIPEITVQRGQTYTFEVYGGNNPNQSASYHPFYITTDPAGGYAQLGEAARGGSYCSYEDTASTGNPDDASSYSAYVDSLELTCPEGDNAPGTLVWTPDGSTPDTVYYQCYTHRFLGWKINVSDATKCTLSLVVM